MALHDSLEGLTEDQALLSLVPSRTTVLGLLKHVTYVERVWFDQAVTGRTYMEIGVANTPDRSFVLTSSDSITSVQESHRRRCDKSRTMMATLALDDVVDGRGQRTDGRSIYWYCANSPRTPDTPTSCASMYSQATRPEQMSHQPIVQRATAI